MDDLGFWLFMIVIVFCVFFAPTLMPESASDCVKRLANEQVAETTIESVCR